MHAIRLTSAKAVSEKPKALRLAAHFYKVKDTGWDALFLVDVLGPKFTVHRYLLHTGIYSLSKSLLITPHMLSVGSDSAQFPVCHVQEYHHDLCHCCSC